MLNLSSIILSSILLINFSIFAGTNAIYGVDSRIDLYQETNPKIIELARSTVAMIDSVHFDKKDESNNFILTGKSLGEKYNMCEGERFTNQLSIANCTGFLIGEDLVATAGHCITNNCIDKWGREYYWIFDYAISDSQDKIKEFLVPEENVYRCKKVISRGIFAKNEDFAVVQLDRKVLDRKIFEYRTDGKVDSKSTMMIIGYPTGLPLKISKEDGSAPLHDSYNMYGLQKKAREGRIYNNEKYGIFHISVDSFAGNSGSPVIDSSTFMVEGILVRGAKDYRFVEIASLPNPCHPANLSSPCHPVYSRISSEAEPTSFLSSLSSSSEVSNTKPIMGEIIKGRKDHVDNSSDSCNPANLSGPCRPTYSPKPPEKEPLPSSSNSKKSCLKSVVCTSKTCGEKEVATRILQIE